MAIITGCLHPGFISKNTCNGTAQRTYSIYLIHGKLPYHQSIGIQRYKAMQSRKPNTPHLIASGKYKTSPQLSSWKQKIIPNNKEKIAIRGKKGHAKSIPCIIKSLIMAAPMQGIISLAYNQQTLAKRLNKEFPNQIRMPI